MALIKVSLKKIVDHSYSLMIEPGIFARIPQELKKEKWGRKYAIISDSKVKNLYGKTFLKICQREGIKAFLIGFPAGEKSKTGEQAQKIIEQMIQLGFDREDCVIALGGGVTGDLAGFAASIFMRGIPFLQIPTSLLAMVDSSIGGKTGLNLRIGKNLVGTFYQPKKVYLDPLLLKTLPRKELLNGLAELLKHALIRSRRLFRLIEKKYPRILELNPKLLNKIIVRSCEIKAKIVELDEKEMGLRMILNYGHTLGHAIEQVSGYQIPHGQAVSIGMNLANKIAVLKKSLKPKNQKRIENLLKTLGLPTEYPQFLPPAKILSALFQDKKRRQGKFNFVLLKKIGKVKIEDQISQSEILKVLK